MSAIEDQTVWTINHFILELRTYLDLQVITSSNIGDIRRSCFRAVAKRMESHCARGNSESRVIRPCFPCRSTR